MPRELIKPCVHLADILARRRRYAARLIASDHEEPRLFDLAGGGIAALRVFGSARDRFASRLFARGFDTTLLLGGTGRLLASFFAGSLDPAFLLGDTSNLLAGFFACGLEPAFLLGLASGSFFLGGRFRRLSGRLAASFLARRFDAAFVPRGACGGFAARLLTCGLAGRFANGIEPASLFGIVTRLTAIRPPG